MSLLSAFLTYCSVLMHDVRSNKASENFVGTLHSIAAEESQQAAKMCAIILTCISEDQLASSLMHDVTLSLRVPLYRPVSNSAMCLLKHVTLFRQ